MPVARCLQLTIPCFTRPEGVLATLANSGYQPSELEHQIRDSRAAVIFVHPDLLPVVEKCLGDKGAKGWRSRVFLLDEGSGRVKGYENYSVFTKRASKDRHARRHWWKGKRPHPDDVVLMCYSSGTTGLSKGVATTHRNLVTISCITRWYPVHARADTIMVSGPHLTPLSLSRTVAHPLYRSACPAHLSHLRRFKCLQRTLPRRPCRDPQEVRP